MVYKILPVDGGRGVYSQLKALLRIYTCICILERGFRCVREGVCFADLYHFA